MLSFKLEQGVLDIPKISEFLELQEDLLGQIRLSNQSNAEASKYLVDLAYGQVVFTPRHDAFLQAKYISKLPFGRKGVRPVPYIHSVHVTGNPGIPEEFIAHIKTFLQANPDLHPIYTHLIT